MPRHRKAWSLNAASISLKRAREYAEAEFEKAGMNLDEELPDFDKNFKLLKKKLGKALDIPRIQMPVIEPSDMSLFNKRISEGSVDVFKPYAKGHLWMPKGFSGDEAEEWISLGFSDGNSTDDQVKGKITKISVKQLFPTQSQIWFDKVITNIIKFGVPGSGSPILNATVIVSSDKYILDGHHRFAQALMANPGLALKSLFIPLPIDALLKVGKSYGEAIGNKPKASINKGLRTMKREKRISNRVARSALVAARPQSLKGKRVLWGSPGYPMKGKIDEVEKSPDGWEVIMEDGSYVTISKKDMDELLETGEVSTRDAAQPNRAHIDIKVASKSRKHVARDMDEYDEYISDVIERAISSIGESAIDGYDTYTTDTNEIEHKSRSGFISHNDGGWEAVGFSRLSHLIGSGEISSLPGVAKKIAEDIQDNTHNDISDEMKREHPEAFADVDVVGYHEAVEAGLEREYEYKEEMWYEEDSVMFSVGAFYQDMNGTNLRGADKHVCYVWAAVNLEAPYHRRGRMEWHADEEFEFSNERELKAKLSGALRKVTSKM